MKDKATKAEVSTPETGERLRDYDRVKLELGSLVRRALLLVDEKTDPERHRKHRDLLTRLAEDRFTLAVVGQFNRGKSSLMNAILGMDRLPVGVVPLTSVITKVSYGNPERVLIEFADSFLKDDVRLEELEQYVTETHNPSNQKCIAAAEVQLPSEFLRRGLFFVDTPGVGSAIAANTATTERFLPEADAVIFVTSFDSPLGREEVEFLEKVREHVRKVFFVVNKLDLVRPEQRDQVLGFVRDRLEHEVGLHGPRLFPVSALLGLEATLAAAAQKLLESGLPALEADLIQFLTTEKAKEFLARICDRTLSLLGDLDPDTMQQDQRSDSRDLIARLTAMRHQLLGVPGGEEGRLPAARLPTSSRPEAELMEAARRPCYVCTRVADALMKFMAKFQYRIIVNENECAILASKGGLCPLHTWQYAEIASPQGISVAYPTVLMAISRSLDALAESDSGPGLAPQTRSLLTGLDRCRACKEQAAAEEKVLTEVRDKVTAEKGQESAKLPVLCLPHLSALLGKIPDSSLARALVDFEAALFERLAENMERYALKHEALRRGLQSRDEQVAYHLGLSQLVGDKRLQAPWRVEYLL